MRGSADGGQQRYRGNHSAQAKTEALKSFFLFPKFFLFSPLRFKVFCSTTWLRGGAAPAPADDDEDDLQAYLSSLAVGSTPRRAAQPNDREHAKLAKYMATLSDRRVNCHSARTTAHHSCAAGDHTAGAHPGPGSPCRRLLGLSDDDDDDDDSGAAPRSFHQQTKEKEKEKEKEKSSERCNDEKGRSTI
jgi:hypothetical protein